MKLCERCGKPMELNNDPEVGPRGWYCTPECDESHFLATLNPEERKAYLHAAAHEEARMAAMYNLAEVPDVEVE